MSRWVSSTLHIILYFEKSVSLFVCLETSPSFGLFAPKLGWVVDLLQTCDNSDHCLVIGNAIMLKGFHGLRAAQTVAE